MEHASVCVWVWGLQRLVTEDHHLVTEYTNYQRHVSKENRQLRKITLYLPNRTLTLWIPSFQGPSAAACRSVVFFLIM